MADDRRSRSPHGERGLKYEKGVPTRLTYGRSPHGERGLKWIVCDDVVSDARRSPHGERGLKYQGIQAHL